MAGGVDDLARQLQDISARLREIGEDGLNRELSRGIGRAVKPVPDRIRASMRPHLPDRYAAVLDADTKIGRRTTQTPDGTQVTIYAANASFRKRRLQRLDNGILWHPLFGRFPRRDPRNVWRQQGEPSVKPGWFSGPVQAAVPEVRAAIEDTLSEVVRKAVGE